MNQAPSSSQSRQPIERYGHDELTQEVIEEILALDRENMTPILEAAGMPFPDEKRRAGLAGPTVRIIAARLNDRLAGYIEYCRDFDDEQDIHVGSLQLHPEHRGTRLLPLLIRECVMELRECAFRDAVTGVQRNNMQAIRLYRRFGFTFHEREDKPTSLRLTAPRELLYSPAVEAMERICAASKRYAPGNE